MHARDGRTCKRTDGRQDGK